jgi:hypothetical protein
VAGSAVGTIPPAALLAVLSLVDDTWKTASDGAAIIDTWDEQERREAFQWANAIAHNVGALADQLKRPTFTNIDEPADDAAPDEGAE